MERCGKDRCTSSAGVSAHEKLRNRLQGDRAGLDISEEGSIVFSYLLPVLARQGQVA